jgi:hypothetical protein
VTHKLFYRAKRQREPGYRERRFPLAASLLAWFRAFGRDYAEAYHLPGEDELDGPQTASGALVIDDEGEARLTPEPPDEAIDLMDREVIVPSPIRTFGAERPCTLAHVPIARGKCAECGGNHQPSVTEKDGKLYPAGHTYGPPESTTQTPSATGAATWKRVFTREDPASDVCKRGLHSFSWRHANQSCRYCGQPPKV